MYFKIAHRTPGQGEGPDGRRLAGRSSTSRGWVAKDSFDSEQEEYATAAAWKGEDRRSRSR